MKVTSILQVRREDMGKIRNTFIAAVIAVAACSPSANACGPSQLVGKWDFYLVEPRGLAGYGKNVTISATGSMLGQFMWLDGQGTPWFTLKSTDLIQVSTACDVTGGFAITYGATESRTFALRATMTRDGDMIMSAPFSWPNFTGGLMVNMVRKP